MDASLDNLGVVVVGVATGTNACLLARSLAFIESQKAIAFLFFF